MFKFEINGLDELQKELKNMEQAAKDLEGTKSVPLDDLFTQDFVSKYTDFISFEDFLLNGNFSIESQEDFDSIPEAALDVHVLRTTKFNNWQDMIGTAAEEYAAKKLGF